MVKRAQHLTLEGRNMVHEALLSNQKIESLILSSSSKEDPKIKEIEKLARAKGVRIQVLRAEELLKLADSKNPQGVIATMLIPEEPSLEQILKDKRDAFILLVNHIDYEQNLGAIIRTAWAAGVDLVIASPSGVSQVTPVVAKVSMGGAANVPLLSMSLFQALKLLHRYAVPVVGIEVNKGESIYKTNLRGPIAIMMGGEEVGISEPLMKECDIMAHISMKKGMASLNVSVATALVLFEKLRQEG